MATPIVGDPRHAGRRMAVAPLERLAPGLALACCGAAAGIGVHAWNGSISPHIVAVVVGIVVGNVGANAGRFAPGLHVAGRRLLRGGVVLVGARLSLGEIVDAGPRALVAVCLVVVATFVGTQLLGRALGVSGPLAYLVAVGYSICGASAIAAAQPTSDATDEEVGYAVGLVALCGSLAIAVTPLVGDLLGLGTETYGSWVGASVHDVGQVVAAASARSHDAVQAAVVVKLVRVAMLAPVLALAAMSRRRTQRSSVTQPRPPVLPLFVVLFLAAAVLRSAGAVPAGWLGHIRDVETFVLAAGLTGLASAISVSRLRRIGGRPLLLGLTSWALVAGAGLLAAGTVA